MPLLLGVAAAQSAAPLPALPPAATFPLRIDVMSQRAYPGSDLVIEQTLRAGSNYKRYIASYRSDGLKIYGLLTVPNAAAPKGGHPGLVFVHGYIPPNVYRTTERYVAYVDAFARAGFVVFKPDLRGHGSSQGEAQGAYWRPDYTVDTLNAFASLRRYKTVNAARIGMWGHSMGGYLTLRAMVLDKRIKAGSVWGGVVAPYNDILNSWRRRDGGGPPPNSPSRRLRTQILETYGTPQTNPSFWNAISANSYLARVGGPIEIQHAIGDATVPVAFSRSLAASLKAAGKPYTFFEYPGDDHNISRNLSTALRRSVEFFRRNL